MTREEKTAVTALRKALPSLFRPLIRPYGYKSIGGVIWVVQNDMLFTLMPWVSVPSGQDRAHFKVKCGAKPIFADDLLWDILGFEENKSKPASLRVNGAFALFEVPVYEEQQPLPQLDREAISSLVEAELTRFSRFLADIKGREMEWFRVLEAKQERYAHMEVMRPLLMLHDGKPDEALAYVSTHNISAFIVNKKTVGQLIAEYCL